MGEKATTEPETRGARQRQRAKGRPPSATGAALANLGAQIAAAATTAERSSVMLSVPPAPLSSRVQQLPRRDRERFR